MIYTTGYINIKISERLNEIEKMNYRLQQKLNPEITQQKNNSSKNRIAPL